jgi:hypothetical protein
MRGYLSKHWGLALSTNHHLEANNDKGEAWVQKTVLQQNVGASKFSAAKYVAQVLKGHARG